jgi:sigma-E factor negative regulatory protein RseC
MANAPLIKHRGTVARITPAKIDVGIRTETACAACHAKSFCELSGANEKRIEIPNLGQPVALGEEVEVTLRQSLGLSAVWWAYVLPVCLLVVIILSLQSFLPSDAYSGAAAVGGVALYYAGLYGCRKKLKRKYVFEIVKRGA